MARTVEGPAPGQASRYIPDVEIDGWKNRDDEDPVVVLVRNPTRADVRAWLNDNRKFRTVLDGDGAFVRTEIEGTVDDDAWRKNALERFVDGVEGYICNRVTILDGKDLWKHGESAFVYDVSERIRGGLSLEKKPQTPPAEPTDSAPAETKASDGTASNAA